MLHDKISRGLVDIDVNHYLHPHAKEIRTRGRHNYKFTWDKPTEDAI